jgi:hypothetical protein
MRKIYFLFVLFLPVLVYSQGVINNGAKIVITSGAELFIDGDAVADYTNSTTGGVNGTIDLDGKLRLEGDFVSNSTNATNPNVFINVDTDGEVIFAGASQNISNSTANYFIYFEKVTVNSGSTTNLLAGSAATINGVLDADGHLILKTPLTENPSGSLITSTGAGGVIGDGDISIERFFKVNGRWQYVSSPMSGQLSDLFTEHTLSGNYNANLYAYNEAYDEQPTNPVNTNYSNYIYGNGFSFYTAWQTVQATQGSPVVLNTDEVNERTGYITYNEGDLNTIFTSATPSDLNHNTSYSPFTEFHSNDGNSDYYDGWNLVGNPYPCALDWDNAGWVSARTNINNCLYMWDGDNGNYVYYGGGTSYQFGGQTLNADANVRYVPAMQSFFVKATAAPVFSIPDDARVHYSGLMYKNDEDKTEYSFDYIKLQAEYNEFTDQMIVRFFDDATTNFDNDFDAYKMYSTTQGLQQLFSLTEDTDQGIPLSINSLPNELIEDVFIPVGFVSKETGIYTFRAIELNNVLSENVFFIDNLNPENSIWINLNNIPSYTCLINEGEIRDRFYLYFSPTGTTPSDDNLYTDKTEVQIYSDLNNVYIKVDDGIVKDNKVEIYNLLGQLIYQHNINTNYEVINLNVASGSYLVKFNYNNKYFNQKVFIF